MAERVLSQPERPPPASPGAARSLLLQRKCACGSTAGTSGECDTCATRSVLQRHAAGPAQPAQGLPSSVGDTLARPGQPLDADTRHFMETRFGSDFSAVRVHDDSAAAASARDVDAHAYTVGQDVVFGAGQYQPHHPEGRQLLAHELAHTVQQQGLQRAGISNLPDQGPEYQRLEREADAAAEHVMRAEPLPVGSLSPGGPRLSRKSKTPGPPKADSNAGKSEEHRVTGRYRDVEVETGHKVTPEKKTVGKKKGKDAEIASFEVDNLELHQVKGPVLKEWESKAKSGALRAIVTMQGVKAQEAGLWQMRVSSDDLRGRWLNKRGWKAGDALDEAWKKAYQAATGQAAADADVFPRVNGRACEMDHIIELQVGGDNTQENIQILDRTENGMSGSLIKQQVFGLAQSIAARMEEDGEDLPAQIRLVFKDATMPSAPACEPCCQTAKKLGKPGKEGKADKSTEILLDYPVMAGGRTVGLRVSEKTKTPPIYESGIPENVAGAEVIPGLLLMTLRRLGKGKDSVSAMIDNRDRTRLPITLPPKGSNVPLDVGEDRGLKLSDAAKKNAGIAFTYDYLSPGRFTSLEEVAGGLAGTGYITPSKVPFIKRLDVAFGPGYFRLKAPLDKSKLQPPFPGVKITEASLDMELAPRLKPSGSIGFQFGGAKKLADARVTVSADTSGLVFDGELQVFLPGVEAAKGHVTWKGGAWSGGAHIEAGQMAGKIPYVKSGAVDVFFKSGQIDAKGKVNLELPGNNEASLELNYTRSKWVFQGRGKIKVKSPYLKPIQASLWYDGDLFVAKGQAGFAFSGLDGMLDATYENKDGREKITGKGEILINKGRAVGSIVVELHPNQKITGKGRLAYEIKKGMVATAGVTVDEEQKIIFDGELSFPNLQLFERFPAVEKDNVIFSASGSIPIPGASIGPIGLKVKLAGSLGYYYYVGPGMLTDIRAAVRFSPFDADPDFSFKLRAKASIPAGGGLRGQVTAKVAVDAYIAEVGGKLTVEAKAGLEGKAELGGEITYAKDRFSVDAKASIGASIVLMASLVAGVYAEAGVWRFKVRTSKDWELGETRFDTGLKLGVSVPLRYDSVEGFRMPNLADIKPEPPDLKLSPTDLLGDLFSRAKSTERES